MISVIIPAYNSEPFIEDCINSLVNQSYDNYEVIVVNDGSTDFTEMKVNSYVEKYENINLVTQTNQGVSAARNTGIDKAKGDYILFLDADDCLDNYMLEELVSSIEENDSDLVCCEILDQNSSEIARKLFSSNESFYCNTRDKIGEQLFFIRMGSAVGKLYKKAIIDNNNIRFKVGVNLAEDFIFVHQYCMYCKSISKNINAKYIVNNINDESLSKRYVENIDTIMEMQNKYLKLAFHSFPQYEIEYYKHSIDIDVKASFFVLKNLFLRGCKLTIKEKIEYLKNSELIRETFDKLPIEDNRRLPKMKNDYIQYRIFCTKNIYFILLSYYGLENAKRVKSKLKRVFRG